MESDIRKTIDFYNDQADIFEEKTRTLQKPAWMERFASLLPPHGKMLDLGCAYGRDVKTYHDMGFEVVGVDGSEVMIEKAKKLVPECEFSVGDVRSIELEPESLDGIWASAIFVHIPKKDMPALIERLYRALKSGGKLYAAVYVGDGEGMEADERYAGAAKYYTYFSTEEFRKLLIDAGFSLVDFVPRNKSGYERHDILELIAEKKT